MKNKNRGDDLTVDLTVSHVTRGPGRGPVQGDFYKGAIQDTSYSETKH